MNAEINILQIVENISVTVITRVNNKEQKENYDNQVDGFWVFFTALHKKDQKRTTINITHLMNRKRFIAKLKALI